MLSGGTIRKNKTFLLQAQGRHLDLLLKNSQNIFGCKVLAKEDPISKSAKSNTAVLAVT